MDVAPVIAVLLAGLLAGSELTSWGIVHPMLWKLEHRAQVCAEKLAYRRFASRPVPDDSDGGGVLVAAGAVEGADSTSLALSAGGCFALMLAITLLGNMPINLRIFR